jgi:tRNA G37 N-methylase Trm5
VRNVNVIHGDARDAVKKIGSIADRVIMNLPKTSGDFLDIVPAVAKKGAIIHFYYFLQEGELFDKAIEIIRKKLGNVKILDKKICGDIAPRIYRVCVDFKLSR